MHPSFLAMSLTICSLVSAQALPQELRTAPADGDVSHDLPFENSFISNCPFNKSDSLSKIQSFYKIDIQPAPFDAEIAQDQRIPYHYRYHFNKVGVWIFFDIKKRLQSLRFDFPFAGKIQGVSIGMSRAEVLNHKGEPTEKFEFGDGESWIYNNPKGKILRYDIDSSTNKVSCIITDTGTAKKRSK